MPYDDDITPPDVTGGTVKIPPHSRSSRSPSRMEPLMKLTFAVWCAVVAFSFYVASTIGSAAVLITAAGVTVATIFWILILRNHRKGKNPDDRP
jgi:hypothetical protein